ncbi:DUF4491 family protein [Bacteroidales bacterium OttesenSCG-928-L14]|nr:DUF4491 family protein [Bacteroidales bacterium OttesenSCG-928-L14]
METFLINNGLYGLAIGAFSFLIIALFHPLVIKAEYYMGVKSFWLFLLVGICCIIFSIIVNNILLSITLGVIAFSSLWSILEVFQQKKRVEKGWFPANPKRLIHTDDTDITDLHR